MPAFAGMTTEWEAHSISAVACHGNWLFNAAIPGEDGYKSGPARMNHCTCGDPAYLLQAP
jgi:hypothetical protein